MTPTETVTRCQVVFCNLLLTMVAPAGVGKLRLPPHQIRRARPLSVTNVHSRLPRTQSVQTTGTIASAKLRTIVAVIALSTTTRAVRRTQIVSKSVSSQLSHLSRVLFEVFLIAPSLCSLRSVGRVFQGPELSCRRIRNTDFAIRIMGCKAVLAARLRAWVFHWKFTVAYPFQSMSWMHRHPR